MFRFKHFSLRQGQWIRPHAHRGRLVCNLLLKGVLNEGRVNSDCPAQCRIISHRAPALLILSGDSLHALQAQTDTHLVGFSLQWSSKPLLKASFPQSAAMAVATALLLHSAVLPACNHDKVARADLFEKHIAHANEDCFLQALEMAAQSGDVDAQIALGISLMEGTAGIVDQTMGLYWLKRAAVSETGKNIYEAYTSDAEEGYIC